MDCSPPPPLSMEFSRQEGDLRYPGIKPRSPGLQADSLPSYPPRSPFCHALLQGTFPTWELALFCFALGFLGFLSRDRSSSVVYLCIACSVLTLTEMLPGRGGGGVGSSVTKSCLTLVTPWTVTNRFLCPWDFPRKNTGVDSRSLLQGVFLTQGSILGLLHSRQVLYRLSH